MALAAAVLKPRTLSLAGVKQSAKHSAAVGLELERGTAVLARQGRIEQGVDVLLEEASLEGIEQLFGLGQGQPERLDALMVLVEGADSGDGLFLPLLITHDELQFETHTGASPGSSDRYITNGVSL